MLALTTQLSMVLLLALTASDSAYTSGMAQFDARIAVIEASTILEAILAASAIEHLLSYCTKFITSECATRLEGMLRE